MSNWILVVGYSRPNFEAAQLEWLSYNIGRVEKQIQNDIYPLIGKQLIFVGLSIVVVEIQLTSKV